jgi:hypothetical protein
VPNVARVFGKKGRAVDFDNDGKVDGIMADAAPGFGGTMLATRWEALSQLKDSDDASVLLEKGELRPDFVRLEGPAGTWTLYDTDGSGSMDVALFAKQPPVDNERDRWMTQHDNVTHAFRLTAQGTQPWREPLGRGLVIPELVPDSLREQLERFGGGMRRGGFPNVFSGAPGMGGTWKLEALEQERQVLTQLSRFGEVVIIDLDRDTKKLATSSPEDLARDDKFDAEVAIYRQGNLGWIFYDEKNNGVFDHVIFTRDFQGGVADNELTVSPTGEKVDSVAPSGPLFRPELVARSPQLQERLRSLFRQMQLRALSEPAG